MILKLSSKRINQSLRSIFSFIIFFSIVFALCPSFDKEVIWIIIVFVAGILPNIILFTEYLFRSIKIDAIEFSNSQFKMTFKSGEVDQYSYSDVKIINLYKAAGMDKDNYSYKSNEKYYFANIIMKDGRNIILTSLLGPDLSDALDMMKDVPVDRIKTGYCFIFYYTAD